MRGRRRVTWSGRSAARASTSCGVVARLERDDAAPTWIDSTFERPSLRGSRTRRRRRGDVRPHLDVGDIGGDGHVGFQLRQVLDEDIGIWTVWRHSMTRRGVLQRGHRRVGHLRRHDGLHVLLRLGLRPGHRRFGRRQRHHGRMLPRPFNQDISVWDVDGRHDMDVPRTPRPSTRTSAGAPLVEHVLHGARGKDTRIGRHCDMGVRASTARRVSGRRRMRRSLSSSAGCEASPPAAAN